MELILASNSTCVLTSARGDGNHVDMLCVRLRSALPHPPSIQCTGASQEKSQTHANHFLSRSPQHLCMMSEVVRAGVF
jgi:hypothetical protein